MSNSNMAVGLAFLVALGTAQAAEPSYRIAAKDEGYSLALHTAGKRIWLSRGSKTGVQIARIDESGELRWDAALSKGLPADLTSPFERVDFPAEGEVGARAVTQEDVPDPPYSVVHEWQWDGSTWQPWQPSGKRDTPGADAGGLRWEWAPHDDATGARLMRMKVPAETDKSIWTGKGRFDYAHCAKHSAYWVGPEAETQPKPPADVCIRDVMRVGTQWIWVGYKADGAIFVETPVVTPGATGSFRVAAPINSNGRSCWYALKSADSGSEDSPSKKLLSDLYLQVDMHCVADARWEIQKHVTLTVQNEKLVPESSFGFGVLGALIGSADGKPYWYESHTKPSIVWSGAGSPTLWLRDDTGQFAWPQTLVRAGAYTWVLTRYGWNKFAATPAGEDPHGNALMRVSDPQK